MSCISNIRGEELLQAAVADGGGVLMLVPHMGNWELIGPYLATQCQATVLYKEPRVAGIRKPVIESRERNGNHLVPANATGVRALLKALKSGEMAVVLPDHVPTRGGGEFAPFFGEPALTMTLVAKLVGRTNCTALFAYATYLPDNSYELAIRPADEGIYSPDFAVSVAALNKSVEDCIRARPEHYRWEYKRYRFLPDFTRRKSY